MHEPTSPRSDEPARDEPARQTRWLYARVLIVQAVTLVALYVLQAVYGGG